jgi:sulfur carrier protein
MRLIVNGEDGTHPDGITLAALLERLGADADRVATVVNDTVIGKRDRGATALREGDRVELLVFAGGG